MFIKAACDWIVTEKRHLVLNEMQQRKSLNTFHDFHLISSVLRKEGLIYIPTKLHNNRWNRLWKTNLLIKKIKKLYTT